MNKKIKSVICLLLASLTFFTACGKSNTDDEDVKKQGSVVTYTDDYFMRYAQTPYKIVVEESRSETIDLAVNEFNYFFKLSTGVTLPVVYDEGIVLTDSATYVSIGRNKIQEQSGVVCNEQEVKADGYVVQTVGKSIVVLGGSDTGSLYGVYDVLHYLIDYEYCGIDNYYIRKNVSNIFLPDMRIKEIPSFAVRTSGYSHIEQSTETGRRLRFDDKQIAMAVNGGLGHNSFNYLPVNTYLNPDDADKYHPKWYMSGDNPAQLCYTAHGDEAEMETMLDTCLNALKGALQNSDKNAVNFAIQDDPSWCTCAACTAEKNKYGTDAGAFIKFVNKLADKTYAWFETEEGRPYKRELKFYFIAYLALELPPVTYDANLSKYVPIDDSVVLNDNVVVRLCITKMNYTQSISSYRGNETAKRCIDGWASVAKNNNFSSYMYCANYRDYLMPLDTFNAMQELYTYYYDAGAFRMYNLGTSGEYVMPTGFNNLKVYLTSKLYWNVASDVEKLYDTYFTVTYRDGAAEMRKIFDEWRVIANYHAKHSAGYLASVISAGPYILKPQFWSKNKLEEWNADIAVALSKIAHLREEDPELYGRTYKFIVCERIWINYVYNELYASYLSSDEQSRIRRELYDDIVLTGLSTSKEGAKINDYLKTLI
ncbi:MAG: DUF4838 domain-containing protein [Clostridia bacterium]|nr:DUF4838 domain-containing protein [Clostridia bacterium]